MDTPPTRQPASPPADHIAAASIAQAERRCYRGVGDALRRIATEEGFSALYKGLAPNIGRGMAMNVGMMACSDQAKEMMIAISKVRVTISPPQPAASSPRRGP